jgi:hypothetical protein
MLRNDTRNIDVVICDIYSDDFNGQTTETRLPVATLKSSLYMSQMTTSMFRVSFRSI